MDAMMLTCQLSIIIISVLWIQLKGVSSCDPGSYSIGGACTNCPRGSYCPGGSMRDCPAGTFNGLTTQITADSCNECPRGKYSTAGSASCISCPAGKYCPDAGTSNPEDCETGFYSTAGASVCTICPAGYSCTVATNPARCNVGEYSVLRSMTCTRCKAGTSCPAGASSETLCKRGWYSLEGQGACTRCPAGSYCPSAGTWEPIPCPNNAYSTGSASTCPICPEGHSCLRSASPVACNYGEYSPIGSMVCTPCRPGYYCPYKAGAEKECGRGYYSLEGQSSCTKCPSGHYCPDARANYTIPCPENTYSTGQASSCIICPLGYSCTSSTSPVVCKYGEYSPVGSMVCTPCRPGYYCPYKAGAEKECGRGYYSLEGQSSCTKCPAGHYCPDARANYTIPCPENTYSTGQASACTICPEGYSCTSSASPVVCKYGEYSPVGSMVCTPCRPGYYCPYKAGAEKECGRGYYSLEGQSSCTKCPAGHYCPDARANYTIPCPENTYSTGQASACTICPEGYSCTSSTSPVVCKYGEYSHVGSMVCTPCRPGYYCPYKAGADKECGRGYYSLEGQSSCTKCPAGHYCPVARANYTIPCPENTYSAGQASACTICPEGFSCTSSASPVVCKYGEYSPVGSMVCTPCRPGYYCPYKAGAEKECGRGYYSLEGQSSCTKCPAGHYCPDARANYTISCPENTYSTGQASACTICPEGYSCTSSASPVVCKVGEYSPVGSMVCTPCRPGYYCPSKAGAEKECGRGYYSLEGQSSCTKCPAGHYCPVVRANYTIPCPENTYSTGGEIACRLCPEGHSCTSTLSPRACNYGEYSPSGSMVCTPCRPGYYCPYKAGAEKECGRGYYSLEGQSSCTKCPAGHYCPVARANYTIPCPENSYSSATGASSCLICPEGFSCTPSGTPLVCSMGEYSALGVMTCTRCSPGYYCPYKAGAPLTCLRGTYSLGGTTTCTKCPPGMYCSLDASSAIPCPKNTYSTGEDNTCTTCPAGHSCTPSTSPVACRKGEYSPLGSMTCTQCRPGTYCVEYAAEELPCPEGSSSASGEVSCSPCEEGLACPDPPGPLPPTHNTDCADVIGYCYSSQFDSCVPCSSGLTMCPKPAMEGSAYTFEQVVGSPEGDSIQWKMSNIGSAPLIVTKCSTNTLSCESTVSALYSSTIVSLNGDKDVAYKVTLTIKRVDRQKHEATWSWYDGSTSLLGNCNLEVFYPPDSAPVMTISNNVENDKSSDNIGIAIGSSGFVSLRNGQHVLIQCHVNGGHPVVSDVTIACLDQSTTAPEAEVSQTWKADMIMDQRKCVCSANHITGYYDLVSEFTISILYGPQSISLTAMSESGRVEVVDGQDVMLECGADGDPAPTVSVRGQRSSEPLVLQELNPKGDLTSRGQITIQMGCSDTGMYVCTANNGLGLVEETISLFVKCTPELLSDYDQDNNREFIPNGDGALEIQIPIIGYPAPTDFTLAKDGGSGDRRKRDTSRVASDLDGGLYKVAFSERGSPKGIVILNMFDMVGSDSGQYVLVIGNGIGDGLLYRFSVTVLTGNQTCRGGTLEKELSDNDELDLFVVIIIVVVIAVVLCIGTFIAGWKFGKRRAKKAKEENRRNRTLMLQPDYYSGSSHEPHKETRTEADVSHQQQKSGPMKQRQNYNQQQQQQQLQQNKEDTIVHGFVNTGFIREPEEVDDKASDYYVELDSIAIPHTIDTGDKSGSGLPILTEASPEYSEASMPQVGPDVYNVMNEESVTASNGYEIPLSSFNSDVETTSKATNDYLGYSSPTNQSKDENIPTKSKHYANVINNDDGLDFGIN